MNSDAPDLHLDVRDGLAVLTFDRPDSKVNILASPVMLAFEGLLSRLENGIAHGEIRALLIRSAKADNFMAGADLDELEAFDDAAGTTEISRRGQRIFSRLERLGVPTIAAINGTCVGGGLELVLACRFRIARDSDVTRLGLPETRLGLCPGLGGSVRLPRLVGLAAALDLILSGRQVSAARALKIGLVDRVLGTDAFEEESLEIAAGFARGEQPLCTRQRSLLTRFVKEGAIARWIIRRVTRKAVLRRTKGHYPALPEALDLTVRGLGASPEVAYEAEAQAFGRLAVTPECKNLIFVFNLTQGARKMGPPGSPKEVENAAVVGAGLMGAGIAELLAYQRIPVHILDIDEARLYAGIDRASALLDKAAQRTEWSEGELQIRKDSLKGTTRYDDFGEIDFVVETVLERMDIKETVFRQIEENASDTAIIATNTSALSISKLQQHMNMPQRACGLHFFNPPHRMPLVEVIRGAETDDDTMATAFRLAARLGKTPVIVKDSPGFVVNRILAAYLTEAGHVLQTGMPIESVDRIMSSFGMPVGPFRLLDEIGLDVVAEVSDTMKRAFGERFEPAPGVKGVIATGVTGRKGGSGFYVYEKSKPKGVNPQALDILHRSAQGPAVGSTEAEERMVLGMLNEAARILDDQVAGGPKALDVAMIMGAGFPPFRGGLLRYADELGLDHVVARLRYYSKKVDPRFEPAPGLLTRKAFYTP
jgi:3-hydroxyacyl-CoA dehydrogenase/enoyl-CoA hydratase/3-hydroxybutyryl-CoA epimerase